MTNFSPGPWYLEADDNGVEWLRIDESHWLCLGDLEDLDSCCYANFRLMAAAPDLFESLLQVVNNLQLAMHEGIESITRNLEQDEIDKIYDSIKLARSRLEIARHSEVGANALQAQTVDLSHIVIGPETQLKWIKNLQKQLDEQNVQLANLEKAFDRIRSRFNPTIGGEPW